MKSLKKLLLIDLWTPLTILIIVSFLLVADLFFMPAQPQTFDEWSHLLTLNGFYSSLSQMSVPVSWIDTVANYGSPLGQISHQTTSYVAAIFFAVTQNTILAYNLTLLLGSVLGTVLMYYFLKLHFSQLASVAGAILFTFAPYRIANVYVRGALPEFFTSAFIPLILIGVYDLFFRKSLRGVVFIFLGSALLALSHPMMLIVGFSLVGFYLLYACFSLKNVKLAAKYALIFIVSAGVGVMIASYYLLPLVLEIKYFHHGQIGQSPDNYYFLNASAFLTEQWKYYNFETVGIRENRLQMGVLELGLIIFGVLVMIYQIIKKKKVSIFLYWWLAAFVTYVFLMTPASDFLYRNIFLLSGIQFPWRFLIVVVFIAPVFLAYVVDTIQFKFLFFAIVLALIVFMRFPQLYGKNYISFPQTRYSFSVTNPHGTDMNSMWSGKSEDYLPQKEKVVIVEGTGAIENLSSSPTLRKYTLNASEPVRVIDYTFYFPGWTLYVNNSSTEIVYQDPDYRGVMTYRLPAGTYNIELRYEDTKIRLLGKMLSLFSITVAVAAAIEYWRMPAKKREYIKIALLSQ